MLLYTIKGNENSKGIYLANTDMDGWSINGCVIKSSDVSITANGNKENVPIYNCIMNSDVDSKIVSFAKSEKVLDSTNIKV